MKTRILTWEDVQCKTTTRYHDGKQVVWQDSRGRTRVHASLTHCSFVCHTFWVANYAGLTPSLMAVILLTLNKKLRKTVHKIKTYEA